MLLGTFKTVFNSVFLVPTKTNTLHHKATIERQDRQTVGSPNTSKQGMFLNIIFMHSW